MTSNDIFLTVITVSKSEAEDEQKRNNGKQRRIFFQKVPIFLWLLFSLWHLGTELSTQNCAIDTDTFCFLNFFSWSQILSKTPNFPGERIFSPATKLFSRPGRKILNSVGITDFGENSTYLHVLIVLTWRKFYLLGAGSVGTNNSDFAAWAHVPEIIFTIVLFWKKCVDKEVKLAFWTYKGESIGVLSVI